MVYQTGTSNDPYAEIARLRQQLADAEYERDQVWAILEHAPDLICIFDRTVHRFSFINNASQSQTTRTHPHDAQADDGSDGVVVHPDDNEQLEAVAQHLDAARSDTVTWKARLHAPDGQWLWYRFRSRVFQRDADGNVTHIISTGHDVTAECDRAEELRRNQVLLQKLLDNMPISIALTDMEGRIRLVNKNVLRNLNRTEAEVINHFQEDILPPGHTFDVPHLIQTLSETDGPLIIESHFPLPIGWRSYEVCLFVIPDDAGTPTAIAAVSIDITQRKQTEEALRQSETRLRFLLSEGPVAIYSCRTYGDYGATFMSENVSTLLGYPPHLFTDESDFWASNIHPDDRARVFDGIQHVFAHDIHSHQYRYRHQDGSYRWMYDCLRLIRDANGQPVEMIGFWEDITEEVQIEQELQEYRELLEQFVAEQTAELRDANQRLYFHIENSPLAVIEWDQNWIVQRWSGQAEAIFGWAESEVLGRHYGEWRFVYEEDVGSVDVMLSHLAEGAMPRIATRNRNYTKDGRIIVCDWYHSALLDAAGNFVSTFSLVQDVTNYVQAMNALRESKARLRSIVENFPNGSVYLFDHGLRFLIADGMELREVGFDPAEVEGRTLAETLDAEATALLEPYYRQALAGQTNRLELESMGRSYQIYFVPVYGPDKTIIAGLVMSQNITEQKQAEAELAELNRTLELRVRERTEELELANVELAYANRAKDEFLATMSHELRTPLNAILGLSEILLEEFHSPLSQRQRGYLTTIQESGHHLLSLINDILDLSKIGSVHDELHIDSVVVHSVCLAGIRMVQQLARKKNLTIAQNFDKQVVLMHTDERRLKQILVNLLSNAVKFTPEGGQVGLEVRGDIERQVVEFTVWDTGIGIAPEHVETIFQPFFQLDQGLSRQYEGSGLGLTLVARLVRMQQGTIQVESAPGAGSRFTVTLPWQKAGSNPVSSNEAVAELWTPVHQGEAPSTDGPLLLLVEDNGLTIKMMREYLQHRAFRCRWRTTVRKRLDMLELPVRP
ncbi:MAG: PAS domain S-box protein [Chloroflexaceae bacterium]|nr:PAS domain S-box protein [Chloroflexaceae bacterium]